MDYSNSKYSNYIIAAPPCQIEVTWGCVGVCMDYVVMLRNSVCGDGG